MRKPVVYLGYEISEGEYRPAGTGFFVSRPLHDVVNPFEYHTAVGQCFLVTAKHVVDGILGPTRYRMVVPVLWDANSLSI